jgi:hypothetical protein
MADVDHVLGLLRAAGGRITGARRGLVTALIDTCGHAPPKT